jgi:hypothetical protein
MNQNLMKILTDYLCVLSTEILNADKKIIDSIIPNALKWWVESEH